MTGHIHTFYTLWNLEFDFFLTQDLFEHSKVYETDSRLAKNERLELIFMCVSKVTDNVFAYMNVITWGKNEGYIDLYLSREAE